MACAHKNVGFSYGYPENCTIGIDQSVSHRWSSVRMMTMLGGLAAPARGIVGPTVLEIASTEHRMETTNHPQARRTR